MWRPESRRHACLQCALDPPAGCTHRGRHLGRDHAARGGQPHRRPGLGRDARRALRCRLCRQQVTLRELGQRAHDASGGSRAAQYMLFDQAIREVREPATAGNGALLLPEGRTVLKGYLAGGRVVFFVERASDIREVVRYAKAHGMKPVIAGGTEAWVVAKELAAADVPVVLDPLNNLPSDFDRLGSRFDNAKLLNDAGVRIAFSFSDSFQARKNRQLARQRRRARTALGGRTCGHHVEPGRDLRHRQGSRAHRAGPGRGSRAVERRSARGHDRRGAGLDRGQCGHDAIAPDGTAGQIPRARECGHRPLISAVSGSACGGASGFRRGRPGSRSALTSRARSSDRAQTCWLRPFAFQSGLHNS